MDRAKKPPAAAPSQSFRTLAKSGSALDEIQRVLLKQRRTPYARDQQPGLLFSKSVERLVNAVVAIRKTSPDKAARKGAKAKAVLRDITQIWDREGRYVRVPYLLEELIATSNPAAPRLEVAAVTHKLLSEFSEAEELTGGMRSTPFATEAGMAHFYGAVTGAPVSFVFADGINFAGTNLHMRKLMAAAMGFAPLAMDEQPAREMVDKTLRGYWRFVMAATNSELGGFSFDGRIGGDELGFVAIGSTPLEVDAALRMGKAAGEQYIAQAGVAFHEHLGDPANPDRGGTGYSFSRAKQLGRQTMPSVLWQEVQTEAKEAGLELGRARAAGTPGALARQKEATAFGTYLPRQPSEPVAPSLGHVPQERRADVRLARRKQQPYALLPAEAEALLEATRAVVDERYGAYSTLPRLATPLIVGPQRHDYSLPEAQFSRVLSPHLAWCGLAPAPERLAHYGKMARHFMAGDSVTNGYDGATFARTLERWLGTAAPTKPVYGLGVVLNNLKGINDQLGYANSNLYMQVAETMIAATLAEHGLVVKQSVMDIRQGSHFQYAIPPVVEHKPLPVAQLKKAQRAVEKALNGLNQARISEFLQHHGGTLPQGLPKEMTFGDLPDGRGRGPRLKGVGVVTVLMPFTALKPDGRPVNGGANRQLLFAMGEDAAARWQNQRLRIAEPPRRRASDSTPKPA